MPFGFDTTAATGARRRRLRMTIAASIAATALLVTACSGSPAAETGEETDEPVTIVLSIQTQTNVDLPYTTMVEKFMEENPNITVEIVETPNADFPSVIKTQFQGGTGPDVLYGAPGSGNLNSLLPYAAAGYLMPLTDDEWAVESVPESADELYYQDDELWAIPVDVSPITWEINQTVFDDLEFDYPATFDDVLDQCADARNAGIHLMQVAGSVGPNVVTFAMELAASRVYSQDPDWNQQRADGDVTFADSDGWTQTLEDIITLQEEGCFQDGVEAGSFDDLFSTVAQGGAASMFGPVGVIGDLEGLNPDGEFSAAVFPGDDASDTYLFASPSNALAVNAATEHPEAAKKLLQFFTEPENQDLYAGIVGSVPVHVVLDGSDPGPEFENLAPYLQDPAKNAPLGNLFWPNTEIQNQLGIGIQGLWTGQASVDDVLTAMDAAWDQG